MAANWTWYDPAPNAPDWWPVELVPSPGFSSPPNQGVNSAGVPLSTNTSPWPLFTFAVMGSSSAQLSDEVTYQRNFQFELQPLAGPTLLTSTTSPLLYEGMANPTQMVLSGMFLTESYYQAFTAFYKLEHLTLLIDDRGYQRTIFPTELTLTRIQSGLYPWKTSYQLTAYVFGTALPAYDFNPNPLP